MKMIRLHLTILLLFFIFKGLLTDDLLKETMAGCVGYNGKGVPLEGFDELVDKLVSPSDCVIDGMGCDGKR